MLDDIGLPAQDQLKILNLISGFRSERSAEVEDGVASHTDSDTDTPTPPSPHQRKQMKVSKSRDPMRLAAKSKSVAELAACTVLSGYLWKQGGSGLTPKHWQRRFFVLTDDNCLYYFQSSKDVSGSGMILLPTYTITAPDKAENVGKQWAFKAFNREYKSGRQYMFAADTQDEMRTWMNVLSLASIAYGSGQASSRQDVVQPELSGSTVVELENMALISLDRAGGVVGNAKPSSAVSENPMLPLFLRKTAGTRKAGKGLTLCLVKLLDGETLQLYAEPDTTGQSFLDQVCLMLKICEKFYFGLRYIDSKGDIDWIESDEKVLKHEFPKGDHIELQFCIRFFPLDVTSVIQYATLYQVFLAAMSAVTKGDIEISNSDALLLAALALQATRGDYDAGTHTAQYLIKHSFISISDELMFAVDLPDAGSEPRTFWAQEIIKVWQTLQGILKHLAVLKYVQSVQKHPSFAVTFFDIKNKKDTALVLGVSPVGLYVYRPHHMTNPVVEFSWAECAALSYSDKKFTIEVHDKQTKPFQVYANRSKIAGNILHLCMGLHKLFLYNVRGWENAPDDILGMRAAAVDAARIERADLKRETAAVRQAAKIRKLKLRTDKLKEQSNQGTAPATPPTQQAHSARPSPGDPQGINLSLQRQRTAFTPPPSVEAVRPKFVQRDSDSLAISASNTSRTSDDISTELDYHEKDDILAQLDQMMADDEFVTSFEKGDAVGLDGSSPGRAGPAQTAMVTSTPLHRAHGHTAASSPGQTQAPGVAQAKTPPAGRGRPAAVRESLKTRLQMVADLEGEV
eukprot:m.484138 g.484138  ORF g.484138 m.484138 type:complete len:798 (-) comp57197_c1_seq9:252-2645(-)